MHQYRELTVLKSIPLQVKYDIRGVFEAKLLVIMHLRKFAGDNKALWWFNVIMVKLHNRRDILYEEYNTGSRQINTGNSLITMIKYRKTKITYTDRDDQQCNSKSREECVIECKIKKYIAQYGQYPAQFLIRNTEAINSSLKFSSVNMLGTMRQVDPDCQAKCSNQDMDCYREIYIFDMTGTTDYGTERQSHTLVVEYPIHSTTVFEISLKMSFEEYICFIASTIGMWFGYSLMMVSDVLPWIIIKLKPSVANIVFTINVFE